jgi:hypothetical protein
MRRVSPPAERLSQLIRDIYGRNPFYTRKLDAVGVRPDTLRFPSDLTKLPVTTKQELVADQQAAPPWGTNLTEPLSTSRAITRPIDAGSPRDGRHGEWRDARVLKNGLQRRDCRWRDRVFPFSFDRSWFRTARSRMPMGALYSRRRNVGWAAA